MKRRTYIQPKLSVLEFMAEPLLDSSVEKRGYAIDNEEADDDNIITIERQTDYFSMELD